MVNRFNCSDSIVDQLSKVKSRIKLTAYFFPHKRVQQPNPAVVVCQQSLCIEVSCIILPQGNREAARAVQGSEFRRASGHGVLQR